MPLNCEHAPALLLLFNHRLTSSQEADARASLGVERIINPPSEISRLWAEIPPEEDDISTWLAPHTENGALFKSKGTVSTSLFF